MPQMYWIVPVEGGIGNRPDNTLPGGQGGYPSQPIYHPGHPDHGLPPFPSHPIAPGGSGGQPSHPIYHPGHPDHGLPAHPDQGLPGGSGGQPSHPIHIPGVPDQGLPPGETIPPEGITPPEIPPGHEDDLIVAVRQPNSEEWTYTSFDVAPDQGQPSPTPQKRGRR